ncbi:MAG TPA: Trk system potassium transporter TrkA [Phycisphaerales bacterium]|nr:Trk system potassium transporter TrkA [Phycisphaerales bacterium]
MRVRELAGVKILIIGAGQLGYHTAEKLAREHNDVTIIEKDETRSRYLLEHLDVQVVTGSGSSPDVLKAAGVEDADFLVAVTDSDEVNMVACLIAAAQAKTPRKIARIRNSELLNHSRVFGHDFLNVDYSINPEDEVVAEIEKLLKIPGSTDIANFCRSQVSVVGFRIPEGSPVVGPSLSELWQNGTTKSKLLLAAIERDQKTIVPDGTDRLREGDIAFVVHPSEQLADIYSVLGLQERPVKLVMISGATRIGVELARRLQADKNLTVKLVDPDRAKCTVLAEQLDRTLVLCADPHNEDILKEENIDSCDAFIACGDEDDTNVLVSLLARGLGARRVITMVNQVRYVSLVQAVGEHVALCPKLIAVSQIVQFIRRGKVVSLATFGDEEAEAMEVIALDGSKLINTPLNQLDLPKGVIVGAVMSRDQMFIPNGTTIINAGDRIVFFVQSAARTKLEKLLVKTERL